MTSDQRPPATELSRRQMITRGVAIGGAVWTVPAVTVVSMTPAHAAQPSGAPPENKPPENKPPENKPPENKPPEKEPPENKPPEKEPPEDKAPPSIEEDDNPEAVPTLPKTGSDGVGSKVALGLGLAATGAGAIAASRKAHRGDEGIAT